MYPIIIYLTLADPDDDRRFKALFHRYWETMVNMAEHILGNKMDAEDAAQNAFLNLFRKFEKYRDLSDEGIVYLLYIITQNSAKDIYRTNAINGQRSVSFEDIKFASDLHQNKDDSKLLEAMIKLNGSDRRIIVLKYYYDHDIKSIAKYFGISVKTAYKRLERAKVKLTAALEDIGNEE